MHFADVLVVDLVEIRFEATPVEVNALNEDFLLTLPPSEKDAKFALDFSEF